MHSGSQVLSVVNALPESPQRLDVFAAMVGTALSHCEWQEVDSIDAGVGLVASEQGLCMHNAENPKNGDVRVDFLSNALAYRKAKGGGKNELIAKAIGIKGSKDYRVIDATAGLGTDSYVLASVGCHVTMLERSPLVAALLKDALSRLANEPEALWLADKLDFHHGDSVTLLKQWTQTPPIGYVRPDAIYLDPMFPHRKKSALVKKEMQALQQLLGVDPDADDLLTPALLLAQKRVVVKRPASAPFLGDRKPNLSMSSKKHRFDIYLTQ